LVYTRSAPDANAARAFCREVARPSPVLSAKQPSIAAGFMAKSARSDLRDADGCKHLGDRLE